MTHVSRFLETLKHFWALQKIRIIIIVKSQTIAFTPLNRFHAIMLQRNVGLVEVVVVEWEVGGLDSAYLRTLSAAVAAAEFLTVAISRTPK